MPAVGGKASRRDFITALVAIVVGGLVSLSGVVVGCQSSRDSQQTAREAQREMERAERSQADLTELRSVLDRAAADLQNLRDASRDSMIEAAPRGRLMWVGPRSSAPPLSSAIRAVNSSRVRLAIRLGQRADAAEFFDRAVEAYGLVTDPGEAGIRRRLRALASGEGHAARFILEAEKLVGSRLPE
jgi:hypothetical protein